MILEPQHAQRQDGDGCDRRMLVWRFASPVRCVSSAVLGGGLGTRSWVLNAQVALDYRHADPAAHLASIALDLALDPAAGVGLLTAATVSDVCSSGDAGAESSATVGVSTPTWAAAPDGEWSRWRPGTVNIVGWVPAALSDAALVNLVATVTEAKTQALLDAGVPGTGTASDAVVICCPLDAAGELEPYGGPRSTWGARMARATYRAVTDGTRRFCADLLGSQPSSAAQNVAPAAAAHGGDGARLADRLGVNPTEVLDLSASLNPCAPDVAARAAAHLDALTRYPDDRPATAALAAALGVDHERVVLTNGGSEAVALVAAQLGAGWVEPPEFSLYERHLAAIRPDAGRWCSNPNNPTGRLAGTGEVAAVWDEAFWPLATGTWTRGDADRGAVVVGSLTKLFACPGLRLGYVLAPDAGLAGLIRHRRPAWSVGGLACALAPELIAGADLPHWSTEIARLRGPLVEVLRAAGLDPSASDAPWVLVPGAGALRERLARHAILIRDCTSFGLPGSVRIAVPDEPGLDRLASALRVGGA
ncbi:hypothetical protein BH20ACT2_BH20ACT2_17060 [soil metagenome]